ARAARERLRPPRRSEAEAAGLRHRLLRNAHQLQHPVRGRSRSLQRLGAGLTVAIHLGAAWRSRASRLALLTAPLALFVLGVLAQSTAPPRPAQAPPRRSPDDLRRMSDAAEKQGLTEPFRGITTNGQIEPGLFAIRSTGVSTAPVREAANAFLASLTPEQRDRTQFAVDDDEWRKWMNQHFYV